MYKEEQDYIGHRQRLRKKLLSGNPEILEDYEIIELLLYAAIPRKDVKPLAKKLLRNFKNFNNLFFVSTEKLLQQKGVTETTCSLFAVIQEISRRILREQIANTNVISSWSMLIDYLKITLGNSEVEQFRVLFLNKKNILIADETITKGTIDQTAVYPREILKKILFYEASSIILVHNHPSGDEKPSKADHEITRKIIEACNAMGISVHDHIIICQNNYFSFKSNLLI